jgi:hypothetical protein
MHRAKSGPVGEKALMVEPGAFFERRRQLESISSFESGSVCASGPAKCGGRRPRRRTVPA